MSLYGIRSRRSRRSSTSRPSGVWLACLDDKPVGCVLLRKMPSIPFAGECKRLYVQPAARGHRIADKLMDALEEFARSRGLRWIYLDSHDGLKTAIALYRRRGYVPCERLQRQSSGDSLPPQRPLLEARSSRWLALVFRRDQRERHAKGYTRQEVAAPRVVSRSGRTKSLTDSAPAPERRIDPPSLRSLLLSGIPAPCPARVSTRIRIGFVPPCAPCSAAVYLKLCAG